MALTTNQISVGLLGVAAGGYKATVDSFIGSNGVNAAADFMLGISKLNPQFLGKPIFSNAQFAAALTKNFLSTTSADVQAGVSKIVEDFMAANATYSRGAVAVAFMDALVAVPAADPVLGASRKAFVDKVALADAYTGTSTDMAVLEAAVGTTSSIIAVDQQLTTKQDILTGTAGADTFIGRIIDNANTLQNGDIINGGAGMDILQADIGNSQKVVIAVETTGIEQVVIRAQAVYSDTSDNNMMSTADVQIDAEDMEGVTHWESNNSRADLVIEDVRIQDNQKTKDITIAMVETDPGHVDFGVYFDQYSLRSQSVTTSSLTLELLDTRSEAAGTGPLKDNPYNGFGFLLNGKEIVIQSAAIDDALTYDALLTAIQARLEAVKATTPELAGVSATKGAVFTAFDTSGGKAVTGTQIILTDTAGGVVALHPTIGWATATGTVPPSSGLHTVITKGTPNTLVDLVTSKVILDDVGRGSTGGDLVIGGLSVGDTSSSKGVERFEIEVRDNSKLQTINSTNNTLKEVAIVNGTTSSHVVNPAHSGVATTENKGNLTVNGSLAAATENTALPGTSTQHNGFGFSDVRLIDGSAMTGKLAFTAEVTEAAIGKYVNLVDSGSSTTAAAPAADNIAVVYSGGSNDDTLSISIDGSAAASRSKIISGREDFTFAFNGNAGNDAITVTVSTDSDAGNGTAAVLTAGADDWTNNQDLNHNITISGGDGNDTIKTPGAGDMVLDGGAGNDVFYTDNTGSLNFSGTGAVDTTTKAAWTFNTFDQLDASTIASAMNDRNLNDLRSGDNDSYNLFKATVQVTFKGTVGTANAGIPSAKVTIDSTNYKTTDLQINQAIKTAINNDATLSKLLVAKDGPANSLVVMSLIDGVMSAADLTVTVAKPGTSVLSATEIAGAGAAWSIASPTDALVDAAMNTVLTGTYATNGDYTTQLATDGTMDLTGAASLSVSDNVITGGTGNDIIVLGTTVGTNTARSSNEVVTYAAGFGNDVIVNFAATGNGIDHIDLGAFLGAAPTLATTTPTTVNGQITIAAEATTNDTVAEIKAIYDALAQPASAFKQVYIAYDTHNVGKVYSVTNGTAASDVVVTLEGTIDLADTLWTTLTVANFTVPTVYAEGSSNAHDTDVLVGTINGETFSTNGYDNVSMTGNGGNDTFNVTSGSSGATIADLNTGDAFTVVAGADVTASNVSAFVATAATSNAGTATLTSAAAGSSNSMALAGGTVGYTLTGSTGVDNLTGSAFADTITGGAGADVISGGAGVDSITGGTGADALTGGAGADTFAFGTDGSVAGTSMDAISDFNTGGSDILTFGGNTTVLAADATALVAGSAAGSNVQTSAGGLVTFAGADNTLALKLAAVQADTQLDAAGSIAYFVDGANGYVYYAGAATGNADDQLIELTGVNTLTTITGGATTILA